MGDWNHVNGYLIRPELQYAVEAALTLNKPLLLRGEPGTGKTGLAQAAAQALQRPLLVWNLKSDAKANQGLYQYDGYAGCTTVNCCVRPSLAVPVPRI